MTKIEVEQLKVGDVLYHKLFDFYTIIISLPTTYDTLDGLSFSTKEKNGKILKFGYRFYFGRAYLEKVKSK